MPDEMPILCMVLLARAATVLRALASVVTGTLVRLPYHIWLLRRLAGPSPIGWAIGPSLRVCGLILGLPITTSLLVR